MPSRQRRTLLGAVLASYVASFVPWAAAQSQPAGSVATAPDSFVQISKLLTGQASLDAMLAGRLYRALTADDGGFGEQHQRLLAYINDHKADPMQLQQMLDAEKSALAPVPRRIVTAWYTGIVGEGERARCIAFETNLLNVITADKLKPPSYSYGVYGSWATQPV
ncbi:sorbitol dehydrogenase family protein [Paraburkholderia aromaticivorans]|uniref:sorbitol dehydrogenase family protein n=1 Tax=Paraburkholderia aromaticivorans TaxID=2026199 RepID=UPI0014560909|nr:sorbitol dehydrogenase family protein [Paraburkholderia aromaticivorans]